MSSCPSLAPARGGPKRVLLAGVRLSDGPEPCEGTPDECLRLSGAGVSRYTPSRAVTRRTSACASLVQARSVCRWRGVVRREGVRGW